MVRRITRLALVALAVLVATGPSALALADGPGLAVASSGATAAADSGLGADSGVVAAARPIDELDDAKTTDENLTDDETTNGTLTNETLTNTSDDLAETTAVVDETTETVNETTDATDLTNATTELADSNATAELDGAVADGANATENATKVTGGADDDTDAIDTIDAAIRDVTTVSSERILFESAGSPLPTVDAAESDDGPASGASSDGSETTTATGTDGAETTAVGASDAESPASGTDSDGSSDSHSGGPPSGAEVVAGVGALTAAVLFPHLADGLSLAGDVGALSATSPTLTSSGSATSSTSANSGSAAVRSGSDRLWRTATAFRYSRYDDSDPLAHETRAKLHDTVERSPGAYLSAVCERADVAVSTGRHHLDVLEDEGLVTTAKVRGKRRYFPAHSDDVELAAALEDEEAAEVLRALARLGDSHGGRLADELDRDPSTVSHHLSRLEDAGLVEREREGRAVVNRLAPGVERVLGGEEIEGDGETDAEAPAVAD